jgi:hypothetical protein
MYLDAYLCYIHKKNLKATLVFPKGYRTYRNSLLSNWQFCIPGRGCRGLFVLILSECGASSGAWRPTDIGGAGTTGLIPLKLFPTKKWEEKKNWNPSSKLANALCGIERDSIENRHCTWSYPIWFRTSRCKMMAFIIRFTLFFRL